jgi:hypothetical protein
MHFGWKREKERERERGRERERMRKTGDEIENDMANEYETINASCSASIMYIFSRCVSRGL